MVRTKYRNPHAVNAHSRHAGYHSSERRSNERVDYMDEMNEELHLDMQEKKAQEQND